MAAPEDPGMPFYFAYPKKNVVGIDFGDDPH